MQVPPAGGGTGSAAIDRMWGADDRDMAETQLALRRKDDGALLVAFRPYAGRLPTFELEQIDLRGERPGEEFLTPLRQHHVLTEEESILVRVNYGKKKFYIVQSVTSVEPVRTALSLAFQNCRGRPLNRPGSKVMTDGTSQFFTAIFALAFFCSHRRFSCE